MRVIMGYPGRSRISGGIMGNWGIIGEDWNRGIIEYMGNNRGNDWG
jgi:hypothetical protein